MMVLIAFWWRYRVLDFYWAFRCIALGDDPRKAPTWFLRGVSKSYADWIHSASEAIKSESAREKYRAQVSACRQEFRRRTGYFD